MRFFVKIFLILFLSTSAIAADAPRFFMTLADIHFDPFAHCGRSVCPLINRLKGAPPQQWGVILQESDKKMVRYGQDSDYLLLHSVLTAAHEKAAAQGMQFVLVLGDSLGHDFRKNYKRYTGDHSRAGYQTFVRKTLEFLNSELARAFPATAVYMVIGNNDSYRDNYVSEPNGAFYHEIGTLWSSLIKDPSARRIMRDEFATAGYYALTLPGQSNLRLIVLNTVLFSYKARRDHIAQTAEQELNWLHQQLQIAKTNKQKVMIALHIPPGVDIYATRRIKLFTLIALWKPLYTQRFQQELTQFVPDITGVLAGHLHSDWFQILTLDNQEVPVTGTPSISPIFGNSPGFKIYAYSPDTLAIKKFETFYYPLSEMQPWKMKRNSNTIKEDWHAF